MNCHQTQRFMSGYLDGELTGAQMLNVRSHLSTCTNCQKEFESLKSTKGAVSQLKFHEPDPNLSSKLLAISANQVDQRIWSTKQVGALVATAVAAAALAVLLFNMTTKRSDNLKMANQTQKFDAGSDQALTTPDFAGHAPIIPVSR